jgi:uncharacterized coiled-coil protein SlyX
MTDANFDARADRIERLIELNQQQITENSRNIAENSRNIERLVSTLETFYQLQQAQQAEFLEFQRTTQAALERMDRILDYLMRRDGEQPQGL